MDAAPEDLSDHVGVIAILAKPPGRDGLGDRRAEECVRVLARVAPNDREIAGTGDRMRRHEHEPVMVRVGRREFDVGQAGLP